MNKEQQCLPIALPGYTIGTEASTSHYNVNATRKEAAASAASLRVGDAAFIKRSNLKWTYAVVTERNVDANGSGVILRFEVDATKNRKSFPEKQWGKYIRVIATDDDASAAQEASTAQVSQIPVKSCKNMTTLVSDDSVKSVKGGIKSLVSSSKSTEKKATIDAKAAVEVSVIAEEDENDMTENIVVKQAIVASGTPAEGKLTEETNTDTPPAEYTPTEEANAENAEEKEPVINIDVQPTQIEAAPSSEGDTSLVGGGSHEPTESSQPRAEMPLSTTAVTETTINASQASSQPIETVTSIASVIKTPVKIDITADASIEASFETYPSADDARDDKSSNENEAEASDQSNLTNKRNPSNIFKFKFGNKTPKSPRVTSRPSKVLFDLEASQCDYDKNPTDLFQALEAREFKYAFEMYQRSNQQFLKDCKTWVIANGLQKGHSLRFRALPLHAAIVFNAPEELIIKILRAYPQASRGRDVKGRLPIHLAFAHQSPEQVVALIIDAFPKGFFAKDKKEMSPLDYVNENTTRSYMAMYIPQILAAKIEEEREKWNIEANMLLERQKATLLNDKEFMAEKIELLKGNYQKDKHDSETQAPLEGFEVKSNFGSRLNKLRVNQ